MSLAGSRCLVTGANGFIGYHLVKRLIRESAEVSCLVEPGTSAKELESLGGIVAVHAVDLTDSRAVRQSVEAAKPSMVFHLAAAGVTDPTVETVRAIKVNVEGTANLLLALDGSYDLFINTGTCHEYRSGTTPLGEGSPLAPAGVYAASKAAAWHFCNSFWRTRGWRIVTLRLFTVYGPGQSVTSMVPAMILSGLMEQELEMTGGEQIRDFIFVDDVIKGYILTAQTPLSAGQTFNLCSARGVSLRQVASIVEKLMVPLRIKYGALPYRRGEAWRLVGDNSLAREILGWEPKVVLEEGLAVTIEWYKRMLDEGAIRYDSVR
jgi:nucleoside-diphosphate-sugar epimerase